MQIRSLAYRTDLIFARFDGEVQERDEFWTIRTPGNPGYHWGNFLLFKEPARPGDAARWRELFEREIGAHQPTSHMAFGVDVVDVDSAGDMAQFERVGLALEIDDVLTAKSLTLPERHDREVEIRPLRCDETWAKAIDLQVACRDPRHDEAGYRRFKERLMRTYRDMVERGLGEWYGAFLGEELVADMGIFHDGASVARYQTVETKEAYRRRGICATLLVKSSRQFCARFGFVETFVIVAAHPGAASRVYQSAGFAMTEAQVALHWFEGMGAE